MPAILLRLYEELNDYLPPEKRKRPFAVTLGPGATVADLLNLVGVPLNRIDLILCNSASVQLSQPLQDGDRVSIYPVFESIDITPVVRLRGKPLRNPRFLMSQALFDLARLLSDRGFDARVRDADPAALCRIAEEEERILVVGGDLPSGVDAPSRVCRVLSSEAREQLGEVLARLGLTA